MFRVTLLYFFIIGMMISPLFAEEEEEETPPAWDSSLYGGFSASRGNTDEDAYKYGGKFEKKYGSKYHYLTRIDGRYRKTNDEVTDSKLEASAEIRRLITEKWFSSYTLSGLHDDLRDIRYRIETGPGIGYYFVNREDLSADVSTGLVYVRERSDDGTSDTVAWRLAQEFKWQITETLDLWTSSEWVMEIPDPADYTISCKAGINNEINHHLSLMVMIENKYENQPDSDDVDKNDFEFTTGLRYTF